MDPPHASGQPAASSPLCHALLRNLDLFRPLSDAQLDAALRGALQSYRQACAQAEANRSEAK
ncbi:hypothetical protein DAI43_08370 [Achromobacter xylosoxidans]|nr:hypothetical protein DAI43_08370 [Achromobacter xylosoxidans]